MKAVSEVNSTVTRVESRMAKFEEKINFAGRYMADMAKSEKSSDRVINAGSLSEVTGLSELGRPS